MTTFIATFIILLIAVLAMALGILMGRPAIKGSCGGLNQVGLGGSCGGACSSQEREECTQRKVQQ
ncbi:(Na+)-NQR maturation NqrM [Methylophaga sp. OBS4]|uniref:(Na+)-NQR maturation NqrM n=1 Tax=Methylophaga sp. OBS4 TaxID=2991935 RepID=UPI002258644C|nr:(Na+)-NQR maturation NqrM [Methylophaga sp. OBS4]MCX4187300.1 (Na+)-NQR maturation NqrM [Methylophaga sp. OBS4]